MKKAFLLSGISLLLVACGAKISKEQSTQLEQLSTNVNASVAILMNDIDSSRLVEMSNEFFANRAFFQNVMNDTIDTETIFIIDDYMRNKKAMEYIKTNFIPIRLEAQSMQQQILDLEHDVENGLVEQEQFDKYYELESRNFEQLERAINQINSIYLRIDTELVQKAPKIDSIINAYKAKMDV